jgi:hypothetical protein
MLGRRLNGWWTETSHSMRTLASRRDRHAKGDAEPLQRFVQMFAGPLLMPRWFHAHTVVSHDQDNFLLDAEINLCPPATDIVGQTGRRFSHYGQDMNLQRVTDDRNRPQPQPPDLILQAR